MITLNASLLDRVLLKLVPDNPESQAWLKTRIQQCQGSYSSWSSTLTNIFWGAVGRSEWNATATSLKNHILQTVADESRAKALSEFILSYFFTASGCRLIAQEVWKAERMDQFTETDIIRQGQFFNGAAIQEPPPEVMREWVGAKLQEIHDGVGELRQAFQRLSIQGIVYTLQYFDFEKIFRGEVENVLDEVEKTCFAIGQAATLNKNCLLEARDWMHRLDTLRSYLAPLFQSPPDARARLENLLLFAGTRVHYWSLRLDHLYEALGGQYIGKYNLTDSFIEGQNNDLHAVESLQKCMSEQGNWFSCGKRVVNNLSDDELKLYVAEFFSSCYSASQLEQRVRADIQVRNQPKQNFLADSFDEEAFRLFAGAHAKNR